MSERLQRRDWTLIAVSVVLAALSIIVVARYFSTAFPEASIDFKYDRNASKAIAEKLLPFDPGAEAFRPPGSVGGLKAAAPHHAASFESDGYARIFLERSLGLENANKVMRDQVRVWYWHHRWFTPLVEEEVSVDVAPTGHVVSYRHVIPEDRAIADGDGLRAANEFLDRIGVRRDDLGLLDQSQRRLPKRLQRIYTFESQSIRPAGAPYRHVVTVDGNLVTEYSQRLKVPDAWLRSYRELRSKNVAAGSVDLIFNVITMIAALVVFIVRLRRGDLPLRFLLIIGLVGMLLTAGVGLNSMSSQFAYYDTTTSYPAFVAQIAVMGALQCIGTGMLLIVICGAGEVLYRERLPQQLAMPRIWSKKALASKRVFLGMILGYALVPMFMAYQVVFYLAARRAGAWAPAEVPYDDMLNSALPWVMVLFAGFFPAFSEEFLSRAFSIPFFQKIVRSRLFAIVLAGFIWGFGHSTYPNQPFWIRGVEVGLVGVIAGLMMDRFGLLPLLIWHYTIDAVYTATLLFASGNTYYVASAALASLIFAVPLIASIALYVRNRGFIPDDDLTNAAMPTSPPPEHPEVAVAAAEFPPPMPVSRRMAIACAISVIVAAIAIVFRPPSVYDAIDYRIDGAKAKEIAAKHVHEKYAYVIATPVEGFRYWERDSSREDGGAPGAFDDVAATYLVQNGTSIPELTRMFRDRLEAGTWTVRFFTPMKKEEVFVEVDPRTSRAIGYHKYQDERNAGASLDQASAQRIARSAFATYGVDGGQFDVQEALSFQQPARRDWLFHFEEKVPLAQWSGGLQAAEDSSRRPEGRRSTLQAFRRVTVRVAGNEITQFNKHVYIPESVRREAGTQTIFHVVLLALKIIGTVTLLALVVTGVVLASRMHGLPWRRALRWTAALAIIPIAAWFANHEATLFGYNTSVAWDTFRVRLITDFVRSVGAQCGLLFLALAGLEAAIPYALTLVRREGRARFGRSAAVAAVTAIAIIVIVDTALEWLTIAFPSAARIGLHIPDAIAKPLPSLIDGSQAVIGALIVSGAVALYSLALRKRAALVTIAGVFCASVDPTVTMAQAPLMLIGAIVVALLTWLIGRYILDGNPLAWPLAVFLALIAQTAATLITNQRFDLIAHAVALFVFGALAMLWIVIPSPSAALRTGSVEGPGGAGGAILTPPAARSLDGACPESSRRARDDNHA